MTTHAIAPSPDPLFRKCVRWLIPDFQNWLEKNLRLKGDSYSFMPTGNLLRGANLFLNKGFVLLARLIHLRSEGSYINLKSNMRWVYS